MYVVFGKSNCKWCTRARDLLDRRAGHHRYYDVDSAIYRNEYEPMVPPQKRFHTAPIIFYGHHYVGGYSELLQNHFGGIE
jgi:glutaredoxin